jgi:uncharacterized glyoxalase superfamily protein PhnB
MRINQGTPYLRVGDMKRSLAFYVEGLGFEIKDSMSAEHGLFWVRLKRDAYELMLSQRPSRILDDGHADHDHEHDAHGHHEHGHHVFNVQAAQNGELNFVTYLYVDDVDATYEELRGRGIETVDAPEDKFYGLREFVLCDPDGYYYAIAQLTG